MSRKLIVEIVGDSRSLERALRRSERQATTFAGRMSRRLTRGGIVAGAALGAGLAVGLKQSLDAAMEAEKVLGQTQVALKNVGASWDRYGERIQDNTTALSRMAAVNDEELLQSFTRLLRGTGDVNRALQLNAIAADLARGADMDLATAAQALVKVNAGQLGSVRRLLPWIDKNATATEALTAIQERFAGAAQKYGESAAGAQDRFRIALEELQEQLGAKLLPIVTKYVKQGTKWLENTENTEKLTDDLTTVMGGLAEAVDAVTTSVKFLKDAWDKLPDFGKDKGLLDYARMINGPGFSREGVLRSMGYGFAGGAGGAGGRGGVAAGVAALQASRGPRPAAATIRQADWLTPLKAIQAKFAFVDKWLAVGRKAAAAEKAAEAMRDAEIAVGKVVSEFDLGVPGGKLTVGAINAAMAERQKIVFARQMGWQQFAAERATTTKTISDDLLVARRMEKMIKDQIATEGRTLDLTRQLWDVRQRIRDLNKRKSEQITPELGAVGGARVAGLLGRGLGLGPGGQGRLAQNIAGLKLTAVTVDNRIILDGREVARSVNTSNARTDRRTARQTSGYRG